MSSAYGNLDYSKWDNLDISSDEEAPQVRLKRCGKADPRIGPAAASVPAFSGRDVGRELRREARVVEASRRRRGVAFVASASQHRVVVIVAALRSLRRDARVVASP